MNIDNTGELERRIEEYLKMERHDAIAILTDCRDAFVTATNVAREQFGIAKRMIDAKNKAEHQLAAERETHHKELQDMVKANFEATDQLAAERTNAEAWRLTAKGKEQAYVKMEQQLAAEQSERCEICNSELSQCGVQDMDGEPSLDCLVCKLRATLAAVRQAYDKHHAAMSEQLDAEREKVQTLVELLEQVLSETVNAPTYPDGPCLDKETRDDIKAALAKVKEGK